jgi:hypothetical protein
MDWFDVAKTITQPPVRDEVADDLDALVKSLGSLASDLEKLADEVGAARSELTKEAA